jgi:predicted nucleic acid-binding protein
MHRKWVVNASPLIVLGRINHLFLLKHLAEEIVVPAGVAKEIARGPEDDPAKQWLQAIPHSVSLNGLKGRRESLVPGARQT